MPIQLGTYHTIKATLPYIRETHGSYILVSATLHYRGTSLLSPSLPFDPTNVLRGVGTPYQVHVSSAKAAVDALSNVLAVEEGPRGVRSNVIAPGLIAETAGWDRLAPKSADIDDIVAETARNIPLQRAGYSQDVANMAVFLCSEAAGYITGQTLVSILGECGLSVGGLTCCGDRSSMVVANTCEPHNSHIP